MFCFSKLNPDTHKRCCSSKLIPEDDDDKVVDVDVDVDDGLYLYFNEFCCDHAVVSSQEILVGRVMEQSSLAGVAAAISGWCLREWTSPTTVCPPCTCQCLCETVDSSPVISWVGILVALVFLAVGILAFVWFTAVSQSVPGPQKGTKGVFGVAGKALPIKY